jgi:hypothetical protein
MDGQIEFFLSLIEVILNVKSMSKSESSDATSEDTALWSNTRNLIV